MCFCILYFIRFIGVIITIHITVSCLEISGNVKVMILSKCWAIILVTINRTIHLLYWVYFLFVALKKESCFAFIFLVSIWCLIPLTGCISTEHIPIFWLTKYQCWALITAFLIKCLRIHSMLSTLKNKANLRQGIFLGLYSLN